MEADCCKVSEELVLWARDLRRDLHRHPELKFEEHRTAGLIADVLRELGLDEVAPGVGGTGVVGLLSGASSGPTVALRADMDALPIREETGLPWTSENDGVMHACGHDGHMAVLLGTARALAGMRQKLPGRVKFIFQPGEEGGAGALKMVEAGVLREPAVDAIFALQATNEVGPGRVLLSPTPYAGMSNFRIEVRGSGGHGAMPHACVDPVLIGSQIVVAAQSIVARRTPPDRPAVLSICTFNAGSKENIIADSACLTGTIRGMEVEHMEQLHEALREVATGLADAMGGRAEMERFGHYPPTPCDDGLLALVREVAEEALGAENVLEAEEQLMGAEDFAFYLTGEAGAPGAMFRLGVECEENLHTSRFDFGERALRPAIRVLCGIAARYLRRRAEAP